jgi:uncharacterized integral membrane protein (TIGR00697 family)
MMFNLAWGVLFVGVNFALFLLCYRFFGRKGLFAWVGFATVVANIQVVKTIELDLFGFAMVMTLGNTIYASISMTMDLLNEKFGQRDAKQAVWLGFFTLLATTVIMQMVLFFEPQETDIAQSSMETLFGLMPRLAIGSLSAFLISQYLDVQLFGRIRARFSNKNQFWVRINLSTAVSQLIDTVIFCTIAFAGLYTTEVWLEIVLTTYLLKFIISAAGTPVLYWARNFNHKDDQLG